MAGLPQVYRNAAVGLRDKRNCSACAWGHESHADVELQVFYEDGRIARLTTRLTELELPSSVRDDFQKKAATRVHRPWEFPWR